MCGSYVKDVLRCGCSCGFGVCFLVHMRFCACSAIVVVAVVLVRKLSFYLFNPTGEERSLQRHAASVIDCVLLWSSKVGHMHYRRCASAVGNSCTDFLKNFSAFSMSPAMESTLIEPQKLHCTSKGFLR